MPLDTNIPLMTKGPDITPLSTVRANNLTNESNRLALDKEKASVSKQNNLNALLSQPGYSMSDPKNREQIIRAGGSDVLKQYTDAQKAQIENAKSTLGVMKNAATSVLSNPTFENAQLQLSRFAKMTGEDVTEDLMQLQQLGNNPDAIKQWAAGHALEADKLLPELESIDLGGQKQQQTINPVTGQVETTGTYDMTMSPGQESQERLQNRGYDLQQQRINQEASQFETRRQDEMRKEQAEREIREKGKEDETSKGKSMMTKVIDTAQRRYDELNKLKGLPSTERSSLSNIGSSIASSDVGQVLGKTVGTEEQKLREEIKSQTKQLLNAVRQASGMSAKSIDSNTELKLWLESLGDPSIGYETSVQILEDLRNTYIENPKLQNISEEEDQAIEWSLNNRNDPRAEAILREYGISR